MFWPQEGARRRDVTTAMGGGTARDIGSAIVGGAILGEGSGTICKTVERKETIRPRRKNTK